MDSRVGCDQEVDIKELLYGILKEWRLLLGMGCVCAAVLGGYKAARSLTLQMDPEYGIQKEAGYEEARLVYEDEKKSLERGIEDTLRGLEVQEEYLKGSIMMQISPYAKGIATAKLYVRIQPEGGPMGEDTGQGTDLGTDVEAAEPLDGEADRDQVGLQPASYLYAGQVDALVQAYASSFKEDGILSRAVEKEGIDLRYVKELIQVETDQDSPMLTVTVVHEDEESAKALLEGLLAAIEEKESWLGQEIGKNELVTVSVTSDLVSDQALRERQEEEEARRLQMQESLKAEREELEALNVPEPFGISKRGAALLGIRYGCLGGVLGVFLAGLIACLRWLACDRPGSAAEVEKRFGIPELGTFKREKKGAFRKADHLLDRLFGIEQALEDEQVYQLIETRIKTFYPEAARIFVAGLGPDACKGKLAVRLRKAFPDREIHMGGSVHTEPEALEGAAGCDGVILVAEKDRSTYQEIRREVLAVESCRGRVLGCVLV